LDNRGSAEPLATAIIVAKKLLISFDIGAIFLGVTLTAN
jgi:hypothetical protein